MKTDILSALPIVPEEYDLAHFHRVDYSAMDGLMAPTERQFINGLVRYYRPTNLLEVGVAHGAGTVNLLNAISDMPDTHLTSIDKIEEGAAKGLQFPLAFYPRELFPDIGEEKWTLVGGKDPSEVIGALGQVYDFAVIDTLHQHPVESLNFLCVLPYLADGAIVVLHDISLYDTLQCRENLPLPLACRILQCSVVAEKLLPREAYEFDGVWIKNIVALQITPDTRKYIGNVFSALQLPWGFFPADDVDNVRKILTAHYSPEYMENFDVAVGRTRDKMPYTQEKGSPPHTPGDRTYLRRILNSVFYRTGTYLCKLVK